MNFALAKLFEIDQVVQEELRRVEFENQLKPVLKSVAELLTADYLDDGASGELIYKELRPVGKYLIVAALKVGVATKTLYRQKRSGKGGGWLYFVSR
jgi:hypothetical protein